MTAKIKLNAASGGGSFSLQAPSSSSNNRVFTLPDSADATLLKSNSSVGKTLQTKYAVKNNGTSLSSATTPAEISSDLRVTITPTSGSSLMIVTAELYQGQTTAEITSYRMYKSSSTNMSSPSFVQSASTINSSQDGNLSLYTYSRFALAFTLRALELAGNTNERTYSPFWANTGGTSYLNSYSGGGYYGTCNITVMEVEL